MHLKNFDEAIKNYKIAISTLRSMPDYSKADEARFLNNITHCYIKMKLFKEGL